MLPQYDVLSGCTWLMVKLFLELSLLSTSQALSDSACSYMEAFFSDFLKKLKVSELLKKIVN